MEKILVIDDDPGVQRVLRWTFNSAGFQTVVVKDGAVAMQVYRSVAPSVVILDLRLPGKCGQDLCQEIRAASREVPILVLSASTDELDKVLLLELGADDYVTKPFSPREMLARVRVALRRSRASANPNANVCFGDVQVDFRRMELFRDGVNVPLTPKEFKLLHFLVNQERVVSVPELLEEVGKHGGHSTPSSLRMHILRLRQKLEKDPENPSHFKTVHGIGYRFVR